ncbi:MJ0042 family finger-like domain-containing protein [Candidatus Electrothrix aarhusensis]|uniref:MJ0042 family finger-like domain-containing protein n=1 Tax=Candidatus Electrothrix aarhusensis TaxID=1859131 RepID=A0A444IZI7_9BACT|nr:MJ0042 family finger-like domain-containing protein [Candidatus Electrothrix aarhusensis]
MKIRCEKCGKSYSVNESKIPAKGAKAKCKDCGILIIIPPKIAVQPEISNFKLCPKCGTKNEATSEDCFSCGIVFLKYQKLQEKNKRKKDLDEKKYTSNQKINKRLQELEAINLYCDKEEIEFLPEIINHDEVIIDIMTAMIGNTNWLIVPTTKRLIFLNKGSEINAIEINNSQVDQVSQHTTTLVGSSIHISSAGREFKLQYMPGDDSTRLSEILSCSTDGINIDSHICTSSLRINKQLQKLNEIDSFQTKKEIKYLPEVIREDEIIKYLASGYYKRNSWLIVATDQRLLFLDKGMLYGLKQVEMSYEQISSVSHQQGLILASITIATSGGDQTVEQIRKSDAPQLANIISKYVSKAKVTIQNSNNTPQYDITLQLERLSNLLEKGLLTKSEFTAQKEKLLTV